MAGSLNKVLLIGRLGADPEIKQMVNGKSVARLSLATSQSWKDKNTTAWFGQTITVEVECPNGILGAFYVQFNDWNKLY